MLGDQYASQDEMSHIRAGPSQIIIRDDIIAGCGSSQHLVIIEWHFLKN